MKQATKQAKQGVAAGAGWQCPAEAGHRLHIGHAEFAQAAVRAGGQRLENYRECIRLLERGTGGFRSGAEDQRVDWCVATHMVCDWVEGKSTLHRPFNREEAMVLIGMGITAQAIVHAPPACDARIDAAADRTWLDGFVRWVASRTRMVSPKGTVCTMAQHSVDTAFALWCDQYLCSRDSVQPTAVEA
jgi:hypothetical protein